VPKADLKRLGVERLYMFGSTARGEAGEDSDVDLFFDHEKGKLGLFELMDVKERATSILGRKTNIMTRNSLHPRLRKRIEESSRADFLMTKRIVTPPSPLLSVALWSDAKVG
jgi:predicted nucleotidyltransferase